MSDARQIPLDLNLAQQLIRQIVNRLDNVSLIKTELFPLNKANVAVYEKRQFKTINPWDVYMDIETQMKDLHSSKLANSINNIYLHLNDLDHDYHNVDAFKRMLVDNALIYLTKLEISMARYIQHSVSIYLLQQLPNLETLSINTIMALNHDIPTINHTRLKTLKIGKFRGTGRLESTNRFFEVIVSACPLLEYLDMRLVFDPGYIQARVVLNLKDYCKHLKSFNLVCQQHATILLLNDDPKQPRYWSSMTQERKKPFALEPENTGQHHKRKNYVASVKHDIRDGKL
ncbi:hypothetical protein MBANPS3_001598 [Mucor bainieri]